MKSTTRLILSLLGVAMMVGALTLLIVYASWQVALGVLLVSWAGNIGLHAQGRLVDPDRYRRNAWEEA